MASSPALETAIRYLQDEVRPKAQLIDRDPEALRIALQGLCDLDLMALKRPTEFGGPEMEEEEFRHFQQECSRVSGSLAFLQTQHQSAVSLIARSTNDVLKQDYLPKMGNGERLVGIGFSQLRRPGPPIMKAEPVEGGYLLTGHVPWITGWSYYGEFLIGAALPDGQSVFGVVPLVTGEGVVISAPMCLAAMDTAMTVSAEFSSFLLADSKVAFIREPGWVQNNDQINIALQGHFALGCAQAGLDILLMNAEKKKLPFLQGAYDKLAAELARCQEITDKAQLIVGEETTAERLKIRAWAIDLAARCAHAGVTSSSGAANSIDHPAQRVYREAMVYTVSAQTGPIMEATLDRLVGRGEG